MKELVVQKNNVAFMGQTGMIRKTKDGYIQRIEHNVELSYRASHFWKLETKKKNAKNDWVVETSYKLTAEGYEFLNKFAGLKMLVEPTFNLNGQEFTNPAIILDSTNRKEAVYYKITLYGYGPDGTLHFSPTLIHYNATDELISSIISKISYQKEEEKMGHMCPKDAFPEFKKKYPYAIFVPTDEIGDMILGIAVDVTHPDFLKLRGVHQEKINNLEKKIQTVAKRNAFRKHPATAIYSVNPERKYNTKGEFVDLVHYEKIVQWVDVDVEREEAEIAT